MMITETVEPRNQILSRLYKVRHPGHTSSRPDISVSPSNMTDWKFNFLDRWIDVATTGPNNRQDNQYGACFGGNRFQAI